MVRRTNKELWLALAGMVAISGIYGLVAMWTREIPEASGFFGHMVGILGFVLMLMTEVLYSLRKNSRKARWGRMSDWLEFHIFTGLVGPFMVLLHSSWKFNGLAGAAMVMTGMIVVSGFVGRYIFTAIPRDMDGVELEDNRLKEALRAMELSIRELELPMASLPDALKKKAQQLRVEKIRLERQIQSVGKARRWMAVWHIIHIPLGMALFMAAFIHMGAAIYYATFLH